MPDPAHDSRPGLAIVANSITPYHVNLYRSIVAGIPELKLHLLVSHWAADFDWKVDVPSEVTVARFGAVDEHPLENPLRRPIWDWNKGGRLIRYVRNNQIRAVIINGYRFISFLRLMKYCHAAGIPFYVNADSNIRNEPKLSPLQRFAKQRLYAWWTRRAAGVMSMGTLGDQFFVKYGADPHRLYRVPCWPDFEAFSHVDQDRLSQFCQKFGLNRERHYMLYSGRLVPHKRVDLLIDAFAAVGSQRPDWDLLVVGDGVQRDDLKQRVPEALRSRVVWTGFLDGDDAATAFHAADLLVLSSDHEPWALVIQEAMAAGLAVVSSDVSGAAFELIEDGRSGRIFPAGNLEQLQRALLDVSADDALANFKDEARASLKRWRTIVDPVAEIRRALTDAGVLQLNTTAARSNQQPPMLSTLSQ